ncbi:MAG: winged helix-turn-helix domain-containing protein [Aestuariivirga sp.]
MQERYYAFGSFILNPEAGTLLNGDLSVPVGYRALRILAVFLERPGEVLAKSDLIDVAWDGAIVEEGNLTVQIASLRKLLGQTPKGEEWIATIPRVGYRFVGLVEQQPAEFAKSDEAGSTKEFVGGPSIAVLPFKNLSDDPAQEYFADGLVEELITDLSRMPNIFVIARNSTSAYKGKSVDIREVAKALGVRYVLEGSVRKFADRVRITGQLVEGSSGTHVWADRFEGSIKDIFDLQDQLADSIVGALEPTLRRVEIERARGKRPEVLDAYDFYLRALPHAFDNTLTENDEAIRLLNKSLSLDPNYAPAHAHAAWCHEQRFFRGGFSPDDRIAALEHARLAIELGPDNIQAYSIAAFVQAIITHDFEGAVAILDPALKISGNSALAFGFSALVHACNGNYQRASEDAQKALRLSPSDPLSYHPNLALAIVSFFNGQFEKAIHFIKLINQAKPNFSVPYALLVASQVNLGRYDLANKAVDRLLEIAPDFTISGFVRADYWGQSLMQELAAALLKTRLPE